MYKSIKISEEVHTQLKAHCTDRKRGMQDVIECALVLFMSFDPYTESDLLAGRSGDELKSLIQRELKELLA